MPGYRPSLSRGQPAPGRIVWKGEYGYADLERKIPATIDTPYRVGGVTQALTGVLIGVCIDRYGFNIDQDIRTFARPSRCGRRACARCSRTRPMAASVTIRGSIRR
jgi:CubicO group peptidase (beta-lactamase class C family)